jgi:hypothetical protein
VKKTCHPAGGQHAFVAQPAMTSPMTECLAEYIVEGFKL